MTLMRWKQVLAAPAAGDHMVQTYQESSFLAETVAHFVAQGLQRGEGIVLIVTQKHGEAFAARLQANGIELRRAKESGQLIFLDAEQTLAAFMHDGMPDWEGFDAAVRPVVNRLKQNFRAVRAYGEMVDLLWQAGNRDASQRLEEFWNTLIEKTPISLLCAYFIDHLDPHSYGGPLERVCRHHTHMIPAGDDAAFARGVAATAESVLGKSLSGMLETLASASRPPTHMPAPQATLFYLCENMPVTAGKILEKLRAERSLR